MTAPPTNYIPPDVWGALFFQFERLHLPKTR